MIDKDSVSLHQLVESLPHILKEEVYTENTTRKYSFKVTYNDVSKCFEFAGRFYIADMEKDNVMDNVNTSAGVLTLKNCAEGAFALGPLAGKKVCIIDYLLNIDPTSFSSIRKEVNTLKIKNKSIDILNHGSKGIVYDE